MFIRIYQVKSAEDLRRLHADQELFSWGWFQLGSEFFVLAFPKALAEQDGFKIWLKALSETLDIHRPEPGDSDRGIYWDLLYDEFPEHSAT